MDPFSAYRHPSAAIRDETAIRRYRDPLGATRFLQGLLAIAAIQFAYIALSLLLGLSGHAPWMAPPSSTTLVVMLSLTMTLRVALVLWIWRVRANLFALNDGVAPHPVLAVISVLGLTSLGAGASAMQLGSWEWVIFAAALVASAYACHAIGWIARFDPAAPDRRGRPSPLLRTWWLLVLADAIVPIGLMQRHLPADLAATSYPFAAVWHYLFASGASIALMLLASSMARRQAGLHRGACTSPTRNPAEPARAN